MIAVFALIKAEPARIADLAGELTEIDGVAEVYSVAGDVDLVAVIRVRHHDDLADVVTRHLAALPGIIETRTWWRSATPGTTSRAMFSLGAD